VQNEYNVDVSELAIHGQVILNVVVSDKDSGDNGKVSLALLNPNLSPNVNFNINSATGNITVNQGLEFDGVGAVRQYTLTIRATDHGPYGGKSASKPITINILDENDLVPVFQKANYDIVVSEALVPGDLVQTVLAIDGDAAASENSRVTYYLDDSAEATSGQFTIESATGAIRLARPLDAEDDDEHAFIVFAKDNGTPQQTSASIDVIVTVEDFNDNPPIFKVADQPYTARSAHCLQPATFLP